MIQNCVTGYLCELGKAEDFSAWITNLLANHKVRLQGGLMAGNMRYSEVERNL